jgi:AcrR family transcriptional regulator
MNWKNGEYQPKQKRADEKKTRILDAALTLFSTKGYHGTTAKAIAAEAGVATGSFYRYFRDKKAAFLAVYQLMGEEFGGRVFEYGQRMRQEGQSERDILMSMVGYAVAAHRRHRDFHREVLAMQIMDPDVAALTGKREARVRSDLLAFLEPMRDSYRPEDLEAAVELIYYSIEEVAHRSVIFESPVGEDRLSRGLQEMLVRYMFE